MKLAATFLASVLSLTTLDARAAGPADDAYSLTVQYADLDLNREAGVARLYSRIQGAARRVCHQQDMDQLVAVQSYPLCVKRAVAAAVARIDRPLLTDYSAARGIEPAQIKTASVAAR